VQLAVSRDVSSRREAEEKLFRSEEDLRALANSIPQLAWMANPDGEIFWFNRGWFEYTGTTPEQMADSGWKALHDPNMLSGVLERCAESLPNETPFEMEFPLRGADGIYRRLLTRVSPLRDPEAKVTRWFGTNTNIDEQRRLLQSLSAARDHLEKRVEERTAELKVANQSLRDLSARPLQVQDDERRRLARELHDNVGQILAALSMNIGAVQAPAHKPDPFAARAVSENAQLAQQASNEIRTLSHLLNPPLLGSPAWPLRFAGTSMDFPHAAKSKAISRSHPIFHVCPMTPSSPSSASFRNASPTFIVIPAVPPRSLALHRRAASLQLKFGITERYTLGKTAGARRLRPRRRGFGGIRERLRQLGGTLSIQSNETGTVVSITLQLT